MSTSAFEGSYSITLHDDTQIRMAQYHQEEFYACLIHGRPKEEHNHEFLQNALARAFNTHLSCFGDLLSKEKGRLLEAVKNHRPIPPGVPMALLSSPRQQHETTRDGHKLYQPIVCSAAFEGPPTISDHYASYGVIVWFQEDFIPTMTPQALEQIQALDWWRLGYNYNP